jgi:UDP-glucose 4-epimerase
MKSNPLIIVRRNLMKKVLITGANSYLGSSFTRYVEQWPDEFQADTVDMLDGSWREKSFSGYDTVYHVAGLAHSDTSKVSIEKKKFYYKINTDLAVETARKAKADGVNQFIFMSSAIVYGESAPIGKKKVITKETEPAPANFYGDSKLQAERGIGELSDERFKVCILRSAMVYGKGSKGNYPKLVKYAQKLPFFPYVENARSMIYIENLMEFVKLMIVNEESGLFWPQNAQYTNTSEMVRLIAEAHGKKVKLITGLSWVLRLMSVFTGLINKAFGNFAYDQSMSAYKENYQIYDFSDSIVRTER